MTADVVWTVVGAGLGLLPGSGAGGDAARRRVQVHLAV